MSVGLRKLGNVTVLAHKTDDEFLLKAEPHRRELLAHCYRMTGSLHDAEDLVQETYLRAWKAYSGFKGQSSLRTWLYRIATNTCLTALDSRQRRPLPTGLGAPSSDAAGELVERNEVPWLEPLPDQQDDPADPSTIVGHRESVRLAFVAALQHLSPRQRAVLVLRDVLQWKAAEVGDAIGASTAAVNSLLQRARAQLDAVGPSEDEPLAEPDSPETRDLLDRYIAAFEAYDMSALTSLLKDDAEWSMPPYELWLQTHDDIVRWCLGPGVGCRDSRLIPTSANGMPAFGQYKPDAAGGWAPWSLQVLELEPDASAVRAITFFLDTERFFPLFGLPPHVD